eukprot:jgi/Astpho2/6867/Aster-06539
MMVLLDCAASKKLLQWPIQIGPRAWHLLQPGIAPAEALPFYSDIIWDCMELLAPRLDIEQREAFCKAVYQMAENAGDRVAQGRSLWQLGSALSDQGHFKDAEVPLREALTVLEGELGGDHLDIAKACNGVAVVLFKLNQYQQAQDLYARAYDIQSSKLGPEHQEVATTMNNTAGLLKTMGKLEDAEVVYRTRFGSHDPTPVGSRNHEVRIISKLEEKKESVVLDIREKSLHPNHAEVAASLNNLAVLLKTMGNFDEAEQLYHRSIAIKERALGQNHPQVALSLNNLAALLRRMGKNEEAEELYRRSLSIREQALGPDHPQASPCCRPAAPCWHGKGT